MQGDRLKVTLATVADRTAIYRLRHEVYAKELGQHRENAGGALQDVLDDVNEYIVVTAVTDAQSRELGGIAGFVSITPPGQGRYSLDKYLNRSELPFPADENLFEARLLTVCDGHRGTAVTPLLLYAALRFVEEHGGTRIAAIGRRELMPLYARIGLRSLGRSFAAGAVTYELMSITVPEARQAAGRFAPLLKRVQASADWQVPFRFFPDDQPSAPAACTHGGAAYWKAVGATFDTVDRRDAVVNADVLDAWFDPAPGVVRALSSSKGQGGDLLLPWLLRTSPPAGAEGLIDTIARVRGALWPEAGEPLPEEALLAGSGSSQLIYLAFSRWLSPTSRVLLPDPTYGEYSHIVENVIGCRVDRFPLRRTDGYRLDSGRFAQQLASGEYDLAVLVNPNNPTGGFVAREALESALAQVPARTRVWVDEAYGDYIGPGASIERFASASANVFVCKSLSKGLALSGARAAYLCGPPADVRGLRAFSPPWSVSLPAQVAAVAALGDPDYYAKRYRETHALRTDLAERLQRESPESCLVASPANWILCFLPPEGPDAAAVCRRCSEEGVFLRDLSSLSPTLLGSRAIRIAVRSAAENARTIEAFVRAAKSKKGVQR